MSTEARERVVIKPADIRVGNWLNFPAAAYNGQVESISGDNVVTKPDAYFFASEERDWLYEDVYPIDLTPDILQKCGFKEEFSADFALDKIKLFSGHHEFHFWDAKGFDIKVKYVHQLQNLYFALTGEELTINL